MEEVNKPLSPGEDKFFLTWRNTDHPPLNYEDVGSDDLDSWLGLKENIQAFDSLKYNNFFLLRSEK